MRFRLSHIHEYNTFLAIDAGSYRIRSGAYKLEENSLCREIGFGSARQGRQNVLDGNIVNMRWVASSIEQAMEQSTKDIDIDVDIEDIIVGFSSEYYEFDMITTQYIRLDPSSTLTMEEIDSMIKKIEKQSFSRVEASMTEKYGTFNQEIRLISSILTSITIDGKRVTNPIGFTGKAVKLTICNIFLPSWEFNIMRSIVSSLGKKTISIIPMPLVYTRTVENTDYSDGVNVFIDIGHTYVTFLLSVENEMQAFSTYHAGLQSIYAELLSNYPETTLLELEKKMNDYVKWAHKKSEWPDIDIKSELDHYFAYIVDLMMVFLEKYLGSQKPHRFILHGSCFQSKIQLAFFKKIYESHSQIHASWHLLSDIVDSENKKPEFALCSWLSVIAQDLLLTKKDPFIRILRYILYHYE
jgi:hypothetical protein